MEGELKTMCEKVKTIKTRQTIPIVSNFNDNYASIFAVFLASVIRYSSEDFYYEIIILSNDISKEHQKMLSSMLKNNISIRYISPKQFLTDVSLEVKSKNYTSDLYYRLIVPQILTEYDKIIVVDADMICREDIANVYTEDLGENLAGACIDCVFQGFLNGAVPWGMDYATHYLKLENPYTYVNTGFLLLNAKKYREAYSLQFLKDFIRQHISNVRIYEQDMLNMLLYAKIKFIDLKWNCYSKSNPFIEECFSLCPSETYREYEKARQQGGIIHYAARPKPWENVTVDLAELWWSYARQSPFYERFVLKIVDGKWEISKHETRLLYVNQHLLAFRLKKLIYQIKKSFHNGEKRDMYRKKYREVRDLIKEAVNFRNSISKM